MTKKLEGYIARPEQSLEDHLQGVAEKAGNFSSKIGLPKVGELIGLLHDFGKYSQRFQNYINSVAGELNPDEDDYVDFKGQRGKIDHSTAGAQWIWKKLSKYGAKGEGELCAQIMALCVASHHSGLIDCVKTDGEKNFQNRIGKSDDQTYFNECAANASGLILDKANQLATKAIIQEMLQVINKLLLGKNILIADFYLGFFARFLFSCLIDADRIDSASVDNPEYLTIQNRKTDWLIAIERFEQKLSDFTVKHPVDKLRRKISDECLNKAKSKPGIYTLTVPTGGGKTLASLRYALHHAHTHKLDRIIYIIPYTSIIEQNAAAIRKMIESDSDQFPWVLEHHSNLEPEKQTWHSKIASDNWESPIVLTTMVQFLEILFGAGTRSVRRLHQLANSVLIFDEIQTLPIKCVHLFCNAINFLVEQVGTTVVLCTATQPLLNELKTPDKGQLLIPPEHELVGDVKQLFDDLKRIEIINQCKVGGWKAREIKALAINELTNKNSCLVIVNTKAWSQDLYRLCQPDVSHDSLFHLSTHQCPAHRKKILNEIRIRLENNLPVLCISTQLIEAGVDIDFASVIRFIAGLDSIVQAAGRCNRNGNLKDKTGNLIKGAVHIVNPENESIDSLIDIAQGKQQAERVLREIDHGDLLNPEKIQLYFKYYFYERDKDMSYSVNAKEVGRDDTLLNLLSSNQLNIGLIDRSGKAPLLQQSFMTAAKEFQAIEAPTKVVIVPYDKGKEIITELCAVAKAFNSKAYYDLLKQAQQYTVNVFPNVWDKLMKEDALYEIQGEGIFHLDERYYSEEFGLATKMVSAASFMGVD